LNFPPSDSTPRVATAPRPLPRYPHPVSPPAAVWGFAPDSSGLLTLPSLPHPTHSSAATPTGTRGVHPHPKHRPPPKPIPISVPIPNHLQFFLCRAELPSAFNTLVPEFAPPMARAPGPMDPWRAWYVVWMARQGMRCPPPGCGRLRPRSQGCKPCLRPSRRRRRRTMFPAWGSSAAASVPPEIALPPSPLLDCPPVP